MVKEITADDFVPEVIQVEGIVLVDFWAPWCGPCKMMNPVFEEIATEYAETIRVVKINADDEPELVSEFAISSIPTTIVYKDGARVRTIVGAKPKPGLLKELQEFM
jgi:thioredoxin 1